MQFQLIECYFRGMHCKIMFIYSIGSKQTETVKLIVIFYFLIIYRVSFPARACFVLILPVFIYFTFRYEVTRTDGVQQVVNHSNNQSSSRITTTWDGLSSCRAYKFTVKCKIQGEDCQGDPLSFYATTLCSRMYTIRL